MGIGGPITLPSGRMLSRMVRASSSSLQPATRLSGVIFTAQASKAGVLSTMKPLSSWLRSGPFGPCGVWQLPQPAGARTRHSPRSTEIPATAALADRLSASARTCTFIQIVSLWCPALCIGRWLRVTQHQRIPGIHRLSRAG
ncbi:MAG: hypothetical protein AB7S99_09830 [Pseudodonghicola sp.]